MGNGNSLLKLGWARKEARSTKVPDNRAVTKSEELVVGRGKSNGRFFALEIRDDGTIVIHYFKWSEHLGFVEVELPDDCDRAANKATVDVLVFNDVGDSDKEHLVLSFEKEPNSRGTFHSRFEAKDVWATIKLGREVFDLYEGIHEDEKALYNSLSDWVANGASNAVFYVESGLNHRFIDLHRDAIEQPYLLR